MNTIDILIQSIQYILNNQSEFIKSLTTQIKLSSLSLIIATLISVPLGIWSSKHIRISEIIIQSSNIIRVIPSIAILAIMIPYIGTGFTPSLIALIILAIPTILINTYAGFIIIDTNIIESAKAMGMNTKNRLIKIELPLAMPIIIAGFKIASVQVIATSTLAAFIGGGGLGEYILLGVGVNDLKFILIGGIPIATLSIIAELIFDRLEKHFIY